MRSNAAADESDRLPDEELVAQMTYVSLSIIVAACLMLLIRRTFLFAGTDTTSSALSRILHQLSLHSDIQEKLRKEVSAAGGGKGDLDYDSLTALPYLEAVCRETLRLFPPVQYVQRT